MKHYSRLVLPSVIGALFLSVGFSGGRAFGQKPLHFESRCDERLQVELRDFVASHGSPYFSWNPPVGRLYWLRLSPEGQLSGSPSEEDAGTTEFEVKMSDEMGTSGLPVTLEVSCGEGETL